MQVEILTTEARRHRGTEKNQPRIYASANESTRIDSKKNNVGESDEEQHGAASHNQSLRSGDLKNRGHRKQNSAPTLTRKICEKNKISDHLVVRRNTKEWLQKQELISAGGAGAFRAQ